MIEQFIKDNARWVIGIIIAGVLIAGIFALGRCSGDNNDAKQQAQQTTRSGEAVASAAADAVSTLEGRVADDKAIDAAVTNATQEIQNAQDADAVRATVVASLCKQNAHRNDPACRVQQADP